MYALPRSIPITEKKFMAQVIEVASWYSWISYHTHDSRRSEPGFPDLVLVRPPSVLFVELKTDTGRTTPTQKTWIKALEQCPGVEVYLWRPRDFEAIVLRLEKRERPQK